MSMSEKIQKSGVSEFICEHCGEPITDGFTEPRMVVAKGVAKAIVVFHKNRKECLEASKLGK
jgi:hypothetical protein